MFRMKCTQIPQRSRHYVGVPMFWPGWQDQKMRQHRTTFRPYDLALLEPERDLSMIVKVYVFEALSYDFRLVIGTWFVCLIVYVRLLGIRKEGSNIRQG